MKTKYFLSILILILFNSFCYSQDSLSEIVTWELDDNIEFQCSNPNVTGSDLNNDGYDDYIHCHPGNPCRFQFFMGKDIPDTTFDFEIEVPYGSGNISWGGDLNGNGYNDFVYTQTTDWGDAGDICICFGNDEIDLTPDLILHGEDYAPDSFHLCFGGNNGGYDFNGDGYNDIVAGGAGDDFTWRGMVALFFGGEELDAEADFHLLGNTMNQLGRYKTAGDINGDGYDDLIISRNTESYLESPIKLEIYLGGPGMDTIKDYEFDDTFFYEININCKGDFNDDGLADILLSASIIPEIDHPYILIYYGKEDGNLTPTTLSDSLFSSCIYYSNINQDNYDDIVIRSYQDNTHKIDVYYGNNDEDYIKDISIPYTYHNPYSISCNLFDFNGDNEDEILINTGDSENSATMYGLNEGNNVNNIQIDKKKYKLTNYPNPFNPITTISYNLPSNIDNPVIEIFNIKGQRIKTFNCQNQIPITWDGKDKYQNQVSSGIYLYRIKSDDFESKTKKMLLLK